jgi:DNA helicase-2/ATP-dependent DNA helicase PcrA
VVRNEAYVPSLAGGEGVMTPGTNAAIRAALGGHDPSSEQWVAIKHEPVPLAIVAGAGSGKTAIMAARMIWMAEEGWVRPSQILGLTFTNKAARELEERIAAAFAELDPQPQEGPHIATYHSFADRLIREYGVRIGIDPEVGLLSEAQRWQLLLREFDGLPAFDAVESRSAASICRSALALADQCANHLVTPERISAEDERILEEGERFHDDVITASRRRIELARVVRAYLDAKLKARRIDFGDQVTKAVEILERFPQVAEELKLRYPAILLDEYQDTNVAQRRLMQLLAPEGHNVTAVGDARQNIFQWRGSTLFNLIDFPRLHFLREGGDPHDYLSLSENYRSGARILSVANRIIEEVPEQRRPGKPLRSVESNGDGYVAVKLLADQHDEARFIAEEIERLHGNPAAPGREPTEWKDFAILVRRKAHISRIYDALLARKIPVEVVGLGGLLQLPEVMDTVAWLRVIADPGPPGNRWLARILLGPRFRIHYRDLALLARWAARRTLQLQEARLTGISNGPGIPDEAEVEPEEVAYSLVEALDHLGEVEGLGAEATRRLERARTELAHLRSKASGPLLDLVHTVIAETGISEALDVMGQPPSTARANLTNFLGIVADFAPVSGDPTLGTLLAYLDAAEDVEETLDPSTTARGDSVKLMTVHQAKGLEFEVVFVPGVASGEKENGEKVYSIFPDTRTSNPMTSYGQLPHSVREDAEHLPTPWLADGRAKKKAEFAEELKQRAIEDERRLFYVALTRAKQRLYVTAAWWYERQSIPKGPSLFFDEIAGAPDAEILPAADKPEENPLLARLAESTVWPPVARRLEGDELFPETYPVALEHLLSAETSPEEVLARLDAAARARAEAILAEHRQTITSLSQSKDGRRTGIDDGELPRSIWAGQAVDLASGRKSPSDLIRPLPERPSVARSIGTEIHRWIEEQARGLTGLADDEALDSPSLHVEPSRLRELRNAFSRMGFAGRRVASLDTGEPMTEVRFALKVGEYLIRGRMDAVYETDQGGFEIVDFKTGGEAEPPDLHQLAIYAAALSLLPIDIRWPLRLTYCYLASEKVVSSKLEEEEAARVLEELQRLLESRTA